MVRPDLKALVSAKFRPVDYADLGESIGASRASIYAWLSGRRAMSVESAARLAKKLQVPVGDVALAAARTRRAAEAKAAAEDLDL